MPRVFIDTGARRAEVAGLRFVPADEASNDVDLDQGILPVLGKGRRERVVAVGAKTVRALDRYVRMRQRSTHADLPWLWVGRKGRLTDSGIAQVIRERGRQAVRRRAPPSPAAAHLRPQLACGRRRKRSHATGRVAKPPDARSVWGERRERESRCCPSRLSPGDRV